MKFLTEILNLSSRDTRKEFLPNIFNNCVFVIFLRRLLIDYYLVVNSVRSPTKKTERMSGNIA